MSSVHLSFENLLVSGYEEECVESNSSGRLPRLGLDENACVHGTIRLEIAGRLVPNMGFFGMDDVCLWEWLRYLSDVENAFRAGEHASAVVGGAEQGQPCYVWERDGNSGFLTVADSPHSGGVAHEEWQKIPFHVTDFFAAHAEFRANARAFIVREAPHCGLEWWDDWGLGRFESKPDDPQMNADAAQT